MSKLRLIGATPVLLVALFIASSFAKHHMTKEIVTATITDKERITDNGKDKYLVFTSEETFENKDSLWAFKFNSSDVYGTMPRNVSCDLTVVGWRVPFLSKYRNIIATNCAKVIS